MSFASLFYYEVNDPNCLKLYPGLNISVPVWIYVKISGKGKELWILLTTYTNEINHF